MKIAIIGFGEAGQMFGRHLAERADVHAYDVNQATDIKEKAVAANVTFHSILTNAIDGAELVLSLVTADQAPNVAATVGPILQPGQYFLEMNSIAPSTKQENSIVCPNLVDIAIMAPVYPQKARVPLLLAYSNGGDLIQVLQALELNVKSAGETVGRAAAIKMCRSVMIKGMEALTLECFETAKFYDVESEVKSSLHSSFPEMGWNDDRVDYWYERVTTHGVRRAAEMREVAKMVKAAGVKSKLSAEVAKAQDLFSDLK